MMKGNTNIRFLLADKQILARILKYAVKEFQDMEIPDIMASIYLARMVSAQKQTEFFHSDYDSLKREKISLGRKTIFGNRQNPYDSDLMKGIIINVRSGKNIKDSKNTLISIMRLYRRGVCRSRKYFVRECIEGIRI